MEKEKMEKNARILKNKKAGLLDWFYIIAMLFITGITIYASMIIVTKVNDSGVFADDVTAQKAIDKSRSSILGFDTLMLYVIVGLSVFVLISSALVFNHPAYFIAGTFLLFIAVIVAAVVSNTFWTFANQPTMLSTSVQFPKITFLMNKLPIYIAFMGIAASVLAYANYRKEY